MAKKIDWKGRAESMERDNRRLTEEMAVLRDDRDAWRTYVVEKFRWFLTVHKDEKAPSMRWLLDNMGTFILSRLL